MNVIKKSVLISVILLVATLSLPGCETKKENKEATLYRPPKARPKI